MRTRQRILECTEVLPVRCAGLCEGGDLLACDEKDMLPSLNSLNNGAIVLLLVRAVVVVVDGRSRLFI